MYEGLGFNTSLEVIDTGHKYLPDYEALDYVYRATGFISVGKMSSYPYGSHGKNNLTYFFQNSLGSTVLAADEKGHIKDRFSKIYIETVRKTFFVV